MRILDSEMPTEDYCEFLDQRVFKSQELHVFAVLGA